MLILNFARPFSSVSRYIICGGAYFLACGEDLNTRFTVVVIGAIDQFIKVPSKKCKIGAVKVRIFLFIYTNLFTFNLSKSF